MKDNYVRMVFVFPIHSMRIQSERNTKILKKLPQNLIYIDLTSKTALTELIPNTLPLILGMN